MYHLMYIYSQVRFGLHVTLGGFPMKAGLVGRKGKNERAGPNNIQTPYENGGVLLMVGRNPAITTWDVIIKPLVNNGISNYQPQLVNRISTINHMC